MYRGHGYYGCLFMMVLCHCCALSDAAIAFGKNIATSLLQMESATDLTIVSAFVFFGYAFQVLALGGVFELTNPNGFRLLKGEKSERRLKQVKSEIKMGQSALCLTVAMTLAWMKYGEPRTYFYGFFETHEWNIWWGLGGLAAYVWWFDMWFYFSHKWLHDIDFLWNHVHYQHHRFKEPSAFAQFAVHPVEAALQGPVGHYMGTLFFPFHPVQLALMGFLSSAWAVAAHDGRQWDFNNHYDHHCKGRGRFIYFNLGFLTPFWDVVMGTRWHEDHHMWQKWKTGKGKTVFDTHDGSSSGKPNDIYEAYKEGDLQVEGKKAK